MIVIDMDMPKNCMDCPIKCIKFYPNDDKSCCPIKCDIEDIEAEIAKCIHDKPYDELEQGVNIGLEDAIDIIDKHTKGE